MITSSFYKLVFIQRSIFLFPEKGKKPGKEFIGGSPSPCPLPQGRGNKWIRRSHVVHDDDAWLANKPAKLAQPKEINL
jgi:hypothetical protein